MTKVISIILISIAIIIIVGAFFTVRPVALHIYVHGPNYGDPPDQDAEAALKKALPALTFKPYTCLTEQFCSPGDVAVFLQNNYVSASTLKNQLLGRIPSANKNDVDMEISSPTASDPKYVPEKVYKYQ